MRPGSVTQAPVMERAAISDIIRFTRTFLDGYGIFDSTPEIEDDTVSFTLPQGVVGNGISTTLTFSVDYRGDDVLVTANEGQKTDTYRIDFDGSASSLATWIRLHVAAWIAAARQY
ncbi:hypothetical protein GCM10025777_39410 [Membranihabitans marinus]